jgi:signal transduction histidine kinase
VTRETQADGRDEKLLAVLALARAVATQRDLQAMLAKAMDSLIETLDVADAGALLLFDPAENCLRVQASQGYDWAPLAQIRLAPGESMSGKTFESGQAQLCATPEAVAEAMDNMAPASRELFRQATAGLRYPRSAICVPLATAQTRVGVLVLENMRKPGSFSAEDVEFLQHIADGIALAIENTRLREELQATQAISEGNRLKAELIATLAHEMRTPLTSVKGYASALLMEETSFAPDTQREFLQIIDEECDLLRDLIHDLLESSIIDAGLMEINPQPIMLARLVENVIGEIKHRARGHRFLVSFPPGMPILEADPDRVSQVLRNLIDNAVKYSPEGGLVVVRGEVGQDEVIVTVADQGVGIAPEHLNRLFEKYFRVKTGRRHHVAGTGLGLPIARTIVESHGGRIWAESQIGEGTALHFTLPLTRSEPDAAAQGEARDE